MTSAAGRRRAGGAFGGKTAIVTGGASGIGRALGAELIAAGSKVVLVDLDGERARAAAAALGERATGHAVDVRDLDAVRGLVDDVTAHHGGVDLFFANAGVSLSGRVDELTAAHWDHVLAVNLHGVVNTVLATYPGMAARGRGHLVLTASASGLAPTPLVVPYATSKYAVVGLGLCLRPEAALRGVRVSVLCPGPVDTPILDQRPSDDLPAVTSGTLTARQYLSSLRLRPMPADRFARRAVRQLAHNRAVVTVPASVGVAWRLHSLAPQAFDRVSRLLVRRVLDAAAAGASSDVGHVDEPTGRS